MKRVGLIAFGVTTCVLVPAAIHRLTAGSKQVAKLVAPGARSLSIDGAKIDVALDRAILDPGDKVHVKLTASADKARRVTVDVLVLESVGSGGGRVDDPPRSLARQSVTFDIKASGEATKEVAFTLPGFRGQEMEGIMPFGHYTILVMPPKAADKLERLRRAATGANPMGGSESDGKKWSAFFDAYRNVGRDKEDMPDDDDEPRTDMGAIGTTARLEVNTRPTDSSVAITAPETVHTDETFSVIVRVTNRTKKPVTGVTVDMSMPEGLVGGDDYKGLKLDDVDIESLNNTLDLKPRETKNVEFRVKASKAGVLGLYARSNCGDGCDYNYRLHDGALEAIDVVETSTVVGQK